MLNANAHKKFTANGDQEAEMLLQRVLTEMNQTLSGTQLCVVLGGSYGRGDGGVRQDKANGLLYNDLDFFVFARRKPEGAEEILEAVAGKYEKELAVDVDFSRVMSVDDIKNNAGRLMMQELKRGYRLVCGEDLLAEYLPELPAAELPFSEACRLLLNRGMGLLLAGGRIAENSDETDFIMRNIYKAILGAGDAILIAEHEYRWQLDERLKFISSSDLPEKWKSLYHEAVDFKHSPHRQSKPDMPGFWHDVRDFLRSAIFRCAGNDDIRSGLYARCRRSGEVSFKNYIKYCIKSRSLPVAGIKYHTIPAAAALLNDVYDTLAKMPSKEIDRQSKLYRQWLIFN